MGDAWISEREFTTAAEEESMMLFTISRAVSGRYICFFPDANTLPDTMGQGALTYIIQNWKPISYSQIEYEYIS